jgi:hypothetical protein
LVVTRFSLPGTGQGGEEEEEQTVKGIKSDNDEEAREEKNQLKSEQQWQDKSCLANVLAVNFSIVRLVQGMRAR